MTSSFANVINVIQISVQKTWILVYEADTH